MTCGESIPTGMRVYASTKKRFYSLTALIPVETNLALAGVG